MPDSIAPVPSTEEASLAGGRQFAQLLSVGHQEIDRIIDEAEQIYAAQPTEWLQVEAVGQMIVNVQGWYEDYDEFEDAIGGTFEAFLQAMPHIEVRTNEAGVAEFKVLAADPDAAPTVQTLEVKRKEDLWRVLYKSADAHLRFPAIEFEIGVDQKRRIDTIYNHITNAVWNLSSHLRGREAAVPSDTVASISETVEKLNAMLDLDEPFTLVVDDPTGASQFKPDDEVEVVSL